MSVCIFGVSAAAATRSAAARFSRQIRAARLRPAHVHGARALHCAGVNFGGPRVPKIAPEEEKFIVKSPYSDVEIPEMNLADAVWKNVDQWPDKVSNDLI
jgi:hypothetical protein